MGLFKKKQSPAESEKSAEKSMQPAQETLAPLTNEAIIAVLKANEYRYAIDSDDDVSGRWGDEGHEIWFLRVGNNNEILNIRYVHAARFDESQRMALHEFCNTWNNDKLFPKCYFRASKDGKLILVGELSTDLERGVAHCQLELLMECAIATSLRMGEACDQALAEPEGIERIPASTSMH